MKRYIGVLLLSVSMITNGFSQSAESLKLWYKQPAGTTWENALPVGNGRLGAMVYGNVEKETIQLNEHTVWTGSPNRNDNPDALAALPEIRKLVFEAKQKEAEQLAAKTIQSKRSHGQMFQPVGSLQLVFDGHNNYTQYYRELDIEKAVAKTVYTVDDVTYTREVLASFPLQAIVMRMTANKPWPLLSPRATITAPVLKETWLYDIPTTAGATLTLVAQ